MQEIKLKCGCIAQIRSDDRGNYEYYSVIPCYSTNSPDDKSGFFGKQQLIDVDWLKNKMISNCIKHKKGE